MKSRISNASAERATTVQTRWRACGWHCLAILIMTGAITAPSVHAQGDVETATDVKPAATDVKPAVTDAKPAVIDADDAAQKIQPSRYIGPEQYKAYIELLGANLSMNERSHDPFGQTQDMNAKIKVVKAPTTRPTNQPQRQTSFSDIIRRIQVTTIMPAENRFLIGTRSFKKGDRFPINYLGRAIEVEVVAVTAEQIDFENRDSGEIASVMLNMLPAGMSPGNKGITAPGMIKEDNDAPLNIEAGSRF